MKKIFTLIMACIMIITTLTVSASSAGESAGLVTTRSSNLNVRKTASQSSAIVSVLPKDSYITLISRTGSWWYVRYGSNNYGYCHSDYITMLPESYEAKISTQSGNLNVRKGPGTGYSIITSLPKGKNVIVISENGGWSRILYNGTSTGYVSNTYLTSSGSNNNNYKKISLNVPDYKQTDSRWANVQIGSSGKTIAQIGCTTTCVAMLESYKSGSTIYPDAMSKKLSYSSGGSLYWPSGYVSITNTADYLSDIYNILSSGKPVIVGAKNSSGGQHWVVVTGFSGGNSLNASDFKINDPGSNCRTTLSQFFAVYPYFYKIVY